MDVNNGKNVFKGGRFIAYVVNLAKAEFGPLKRLEANRLMVRRYLLNEMRVKKMRPSHIAQYIDIAVSMVFVPSENEIIARKLEAASSVTQRVSEFETNWLSFYGVFGFIKRFLTS